MSPSTLPEGGFFTDSSARRGVMVASRDDGCDYRIGYIATPHGVVGLYDQGRYSGSSPTTRLCIVVAGRFYDSLWERTFTDRFLMTLAQRFAAEVIDAR